MKQIRQFMCALRTFRTAFTSPTVAVEPTVLAELNGRLATGPERLRATAVDLSDAWPQTSGDRFLGGSDYGAPTAFAEIEAQYFDEVKVLMDWIATIRPLEDKASSPGDSGYGGSARPMRGLEWAQGVRSQAIRCWRFSAVPYRSVGARVARIHAPQALFGTPLIDDWSLDDFLAGSAEASAQARFRIWQLEFQRNVYVALAILLGTFWLASR